MGKTNLHPSSWPQAVQDLYAKWPSALVARSEVSRFSGGVLHPRTMANIDSTGEGPERVRFGRNVAYPLAPLCGWLASRIKEESSMPRRTGQVA